MPVTEVLRALGQWDLQFTDDVPQQVWDAIQYFGHVTVHVGRVDHRVADDSLLSSARYVGVVRKKSDRNRETLALAGAGMAMWLGDEDGKGSVIEGPLVIAGETFEDALRLILPPATSAIMEGTYFSPGPGTFTNTFQFVSQREAINYLTDTMHADWKVLGNGTLMAGPEGSLFVTTPKTLVLRKWAGADLTLKAFPGDLGVEQDVEDFTTRTVLVADDGSGGIATADADINPALNPYKDLYGASVRMTRFIQESSTDATNADARAQLQLNRFSGTRDALALSTDEFDVRGDVEVGDYLWVYDPQQNLMDLANEVTFRGRRVNPIKLRLTTMTWPVELGCTIHYRNWDGEWFDLTQFFVPESGATTLEVGGYNRALNDGANGGVGTGPLPPGPNLTVPVAPTWNTPFLQGTYQSTINGLTKAQVELSWNQPLNTDGSVVADGDYYEVRYRSATTPLFPVTHAQMAVFTHAQLTANGGTFGQPIQYPYGEWQYARVPFTALKTILYELTPSMPYEAQVRLIDTGTPPNASDWSTLAAWQTVDDTIPPATPAAPVVAASRIAVQVRHDLGKSSGGTFNLDRDLHHLEVHASTNSSFTPEDSTRLGRIIANWAMLFGATPVIATFQIENTTPMFFKVVAVDEAGNASAPSPAATATALLIDSAHISDLTASKITAGTITSSIIQAGFIRMGSGAAGSGTGPALELTPGSIQMISNTNTLIFDLNSALGKMRLFGRGGIDISGGSLRVLNTFGDVVVEVGECADGRHGVQVFTDTGVRVARMGELESGGHGIEVIDEANGNLVKVSTLAFGMKAQTVLNAENPGNTGSSYVDLATNGPSVQVVIGSTGRCIVLLTSGVNCLGAGFYSIGFDVSGPVNVGPTSSKAAGITATSTFTPSQSIAGAYVVEGLSPGTYTVKLKYRSTNSALFFERTIIVIPY